LQSTAKQKVGRVEEVARITKRTPERIRIVLDLVGHFVQSHQHGPATGTAVVWLKPTCARADDGRSGAHPEMVRAQVRYDIVSISFRQKGFGKG
jgi:hypothetical protein